jgi:PAS domain S-box-containing protein
MVNAPAAESLGGNPEDCIGRSIYEFVTPETNDFLQESLRKFIESGDLELKYEIPFTVAGNKTWLIIQRRLVKDSKGDTLGITSVCADITELKTA